MRRKETGVILWNTLMIVALVSLFLVSQLRGIHLLLQSLTQHQRQIDAFQELEKTALQLVKGGGERDWPELCVRKGESNPDSLVKDLKEGGRRDCGFLRQNRQYRYLVEDLGDFSGSKHWRLGLLLDFEGGRDYILLVRFGESGILSWLNVGH